ncbi:MAG: ATP synthase F1 subunit epsilon, partial [Bdellovibrionota bacterium]
RMFTLTRGTPEKKLVSAAEIEEIFVPAARGELNVLPGHAPLMTTLGTGVLRYRLKGDSKLVHVAISWGYCQVNPEGVNILAETAERPDEIDVARAEATMKAAEARMTTEASPDELEKYKNKIARAVVRKEVGGLTH